MRVSYTIPGWEPGLRPAPAEPASGADFRQRLRRLNEGVPAFHAPGLRLDRSPVLPFSMPRPAPPPELEVRDAYAERRHWHEMVARLAVSFDPGETGAAGEKAHKVRGMIALLLEMKELENSALARMHSGMEAF